MKVKRILITLFITYIAVLIAIQNVNAFAMVSQELELQRQEEIEDIFQKMEQMALKKAHVEYVERSEASDLQYETASVNFLELEKQEEELDLLLEELNVNKIDPNDINDMSLLLELSSKTVDLESIVTVSDPFDSAPDLAALANVFTIYCYDHNYTCNGVTYCCRYIRVMDNKGHGGLTQNGEYDAVSKNVNASVIASVLDYNFGYIFDDFFGTLPNIASWTLGNIFSVLDGIQDSSSVVALDSESLYRVFCTSVTGMVYHYCYDNSSWKLIGTSATMSYVQTDFFAGNVNGEAVHDSREISWVSGNNDVWYEYIKSYANNKNFYPDYHRVDYLGILTVKGFNKEFSFEPKFYSAPGYIY